VSDAIHRQSRRERGRQAGKPDDTDEHLDGGDGPPSGLLGRLSPYPTVDMVTTAHQYASTIPLVWAVGEPQGVSGIPFDPPDHVGHDGQPHKNTL
jgi:hypothetical protein